MLKCPRCGNQIIPDFPLIAANDNIGIIHILNDRQLLFKDHVQKLAQYIASLPVSSREIPNWMAAAIYGFGGVILWPDGREFKMQDDEIDRAFNNDGSFRWIRDFRCHADTPYKLSLQRRLIPRIRLIDLAVRIAVQSKTGK